MERSVRGSGSSARSVPRTVADEATLPVRYQPTRKGRAARTLRSLLFGLLWILLAGLVAMSVVWILPEHQTVPVKDSAPQVTVTTKEPPRPPRSSVRPVSPEPQRLPPSAVPAARPAMTAPGYQAVSPLAAAVQNPVPTDAGVPIRPEPAAQTTTDISAALSGAARAAWQQDLANIEFVATTYAAQVRSCYERSIRGLGGDAPRGRVVILFTLTDEGKAQNPVVSEDSLGLPVLGPCLSQRLTEWRFPRPVGPIRTFRFPFVFAGFAP